MTSETDLVRVILRTLRVSGVLAWRCNSGRRAGVRFGLGAGCPDIIGVLPPSGRMFGLEVKTDSGKVSNRQRIWAESARTYGAFVAVVHSSVDALAAVQRARDIRCKAIKRLSE